MIEYDPWLRKVAVGMLHPQHEALEDLVQEGRIAMWTARRTHDAARGPLDHWLKYQAQHRMLTVLGNHMRWTGRPSRQGHKDTAPKLADVSLNAMLDDEESSFEPSDPTAERLLERAAEAYHAGEIAQALAELTPRERAYVRLRFWGDCKQAELDAHFDGHSPNIWRKAKPKLADRLAHLAAA